MHLLIQLIITQSMELDYKGEMKQKDKGKNNMCDRQKA